MYNQYITLSGYGGDRMNFNEKLKEYMELLHCTAKELSDASGLSPATLSRYRSGERIPEISSGAFDRLCLAIATLSAEASCEDLSKDAVAESFLDCPDFIASDQELFRQKLNVLISALHLNIAKLCQCTNYEASALFRIRSGSRKPSDPAKFAADIAGYVAREPRGKAEIEVLARLLDCGAEDLSDPEACFTRLRDWLVSGENRRTEEMAGFLEKLNDFDLDEYIRAIHFDTMKVPSAPFQLPTSKTYFGLKEMMESELDFLKATVLSKSMAPLIMYSDMPMEEMSKDPEFPKKWMFGTAMLLKKGLHLNMIHNVDRPLNEMMLGLESWIPMYMTGQVSPFYLKNVQNDVFLHFLKVSGSAALSGEAIAGYHSKGKYYLTKSKDEVAYYRDRAEQLLRCAYPLMNIYRQDNDDALNLFLRTDAQTPGKRRSLLSAPPLYTMEPEYLEAFLRERFVSVEETQRILAYADFQRQLTGEVLKAGTLEDEVPHITREEFERYPMSLPLSGMFLERDILYTYEDYQAHMRQTEQFAERQPNYHVRWTSAHAFRNLQILLHEGQWAMVSKSRSPAIHFVIHHPKLREALEGFVPPVTEEADQT